MLAMSANQNISYVGCVSSQWWALMVESRIRNRRSRFCVPIQAKSRLTCSGTLKHERHVFQGILGQSLEIKMNKGLNHYGGKIKDLPFPDHFTRHFMMFRSTLKHFYGKICFYKREQFLVLHGMFALIKPAWKILEPLHWCNCELQ